MAGSRTDRAIGVTRKNWQEASREQVEAAIIDLLSARPAVFFHRAKKRYDVPVRNPPERFQIGSFSRDTQSKGTTCSGMSSPKGRYA